MRGYSLIEMMIALTVLGLVIGGALVPLSARYEQREIDNANAYLDEAKNAVMTYALRNRTYPRDIGDDQIAGGRPYLPCPDLDNDGEEDRTAITIFANAATVSWADMQGENDGKCEQQKGLLPWKTLGVAASDTWGTRLTYRVDESFSDQLFGFDETFYADVFARRAEPSDPVTLSLRASRDDIGAVVCDGTVAACPVSATVLSNVLIGVVATETATLGNRVVPAYAVSGINGVVDGAAFVIVSHGKNGLGGMAQGGACRGAPPTAVERANAYYAAGHVLRSDKCNDFADADGLYENLFFSSPISEAGGDDIVVWAGSNELFGFLLRGGALPIEKLEFLQ